MLSLKQLRFFIPLIFVSMFTMVNKIEAQTVSISFTNGFLGTQTANVQQTTNDKNLTTLGIARVSFSQNSSTGQFVNTGIQGNDIGGTIKLYLTNNTVISLTGALNWRITNNGNLNYFGFIFDAGQNASISYGSGQTYNIVGANTANTSTSLALRAYASTVNTATTYPDGGSQNDGNAATSGLLTALNAELANTPQPSTISLTNSSVIEGNNLVYNVTLTSTTTNTQVYTFSTSGTATATTRYNTPYTFSNGVVDNGDGTINIPTGVRSFTITVSTIDDNIIEPTQTVILNIGSKSATGSILDNDGTSPTIYTNTGSLSSFAACLNTASATQNFSVSASNLTANLTITSPTGYEISTNQSGTFSNTIVLTNSGTVSSTNIWVRLTGASAGTFTGSINCNSTGATTQNISLSGTVSTASVGGTISGSTSVYSGTNTTTLTLTGYTGTIQWQSSLDDVTFTDISGATSATYTATNVTATTYYRAVVTNGACTSDVSTVGRITFLSGCNSFSMNDFTKNGNATLLSDNSTVRLTQAIGNQNGSIWNKNKVDITNDFDISTKVNLGNISNGADGIAFVLQNQSVNAGSVGGGLGYAGITPSFAVEFDTYYNGGSDPASGKDHIAIIRNGLASSLAEHSSYAAPYLISATGGLKDGLWHDARFVWTAATKNFKVYYENVKIFDITVDLQGTIFNNKKYVYFGLTAATGGAVNLQQVQVPNYCLVKQVSITPTAGFNNASAATSFCTPATVVLQASTSNSYLWYKDGVAMPDSTTQSIIVSASGVYKVDGVDSQGNTSTSDDLTVTATPAANAGTISSTASSVCGGSSNSTSLTLTGSTGTIQWQSSNDGTTFANIYGATSATYTATNLTATKYYRAMVSSGSCSSVASGTATITVSQCSVNSINPDNNSTTVKKPVSGNVSTNDIITTGTTYGTPSPSINNPSVATITIDAASGNYTFTANTPGKYVYYIPACAVGQTTGCPISLLQITVLDPTIPNNAPVANADIATTSLNTAVTTSILSNDKSGNIGTNLNPSSVTIVTQPVNGSVVVNGDGSVTYTPSTGFTGKDSLVYNVCDNATVPNCASTFVYYTVLAGGSSSNTTAIDDYAYVTNNKMGNASVSGNVLSNDKNTAGAALTASIVTAPSAAQGSIVLNADGSYTFTPALGFSGPIDIIYNACTGDNPPICAKATLHIVVNPPPTINPDFNSTNVNTPVNGNINTNDAIPAGTNYGTPVPNSKNPTGATITINASTGVYTFTTTNPGKYLFMVPVCAASQTTGCPLSPLEITVLDPTKTNNPPVANNDYSTTQLNTPVTTLILSNDKPGNKNTILDVYSISIKTAPKNGTAVGNVTSITTASQSIKSNSTVTNTGSIIYTPNTGFTGLDSLVYTVCDNASPANCEVATVYYTISTTSATSVLVANDDYNTSINRVPATGNVLTNDDNGGAQLTATLVTIPSTSQGVLVFNSNGSYTFTPALGFTGPLDIIYQACSGTTCVNATLHILVQLYPPAAPTVKNATYIIGSSSNPTNIKTLILTNPTGTTLSWCDVTGTTCTSTPPSLPTFPGTYIWCVKAVDTLTGLTSTPCTMDTVNMLAPYSVAEISKIAKSVKVNPDGTILATFVMNATNKTDASIDSVTIKDDLSKTFNTSSGILIYSVDAYGGLVKNTGYDGIANIDLVDKNASKIAAKKTDSVVLKVLIESPDVYGSKTNTATLSGKTKYGNLSVLSNDPLLNPNDTTIRIPTSFVIPKLDVIVAGGFSPNQDGMNDKWIIVRPYGTTISVKVFNRWGNQVFGDDNYKNDWDGRGQGNFIGAYVPEGTYFYMVEATDASGNVQKFAKTLTIVR